MSTISPLENETVIPLRHVREHVPPYLGRPVRYSTLYSWAKRGVHGKRLRTFRIGARLLTSTEEVQRFMDALNVEV